MRQGGAELPFTAKFTALESKRVTENGTENVTEKVTEKRDPLEEKILDILRQTPGVTTAETAEKLNISRKTVSQKIRRLKEKGILVRVGSDRKGFWEIAESEGKEVTENVTENVIEKVTEKARSPRRKDT